MGTRPMDRRLPLPDTTSSRSGRVGSSLSMKQSWLLVWLLWLLVSATCFSVKMRNQQLTHAKQQLMFLFKNHFPVLEYHIVPLFL